MINPGYKLSIKEIKELKEFKNSEAYSNYIKALSESPAFIAIMDEHINNVDISEDISQLKNEGRISSNITSKSIMGLFKKTLSRMAINILADSIILKELEDCSVKEITDNLKKDSDITYLLGKADKKYYNQAARLVEEGKISSNSLAYRGLMAYMKLHDSEFNKPQEACKNLIRESPDILDQEPVRAKSNRSNINLSEDEIRL